MNRMGTVAHSELLSHWFLLEGQVWLSPPQLWSFSKVDTMMLDLPVWQRSWDSRFLIEISQFFPYWQ